MKRSTLLVGALAGAALAVPSAAHAAGLDSAFGSGGFAPVPVSVGTADQFWSTAPAPGGGTYNVGYGTVGGTNRAFSVTRTDAAGKLDPSFGDGGIALVDVAPGPFVGGVANPTTPPSGEGEVARGVAVQPDGRIVVLGQAETAQAATRQDTRDLDLYAVRLNPNGTRDATFGTQGVTRVDLSDGVPSGGGSLVADNAAYAVHVRPDGKIVFGASKGVQSDEAPARADRDIAAVQLLPTGARDVDFGTNGVVSTRQPSINENLRMSGLDPENGRLVVVSYANVAGANRPFLFGFTSAGVTDASFGGAATTGVAGTPAGVATGYPAGPVGSGGFAEAYGVTLHQGRYLVSGYGVRSTTQDLGVDAIAYRFTRDGALDTGFGTDGLSSYDRADGATAHFADRARNHVVLPDERIVTAGQSGPDALLTVRRPDGSLDTSVGDGGAFVVDLGGSSDALWGITAVGDGYRVVAAGSKATGTASESSSALVALDLSKPKPQPEVVTPGPAPAPNPTPTPTPTPTPSPGPGPAPAPTPVKRATTPGKVTISCRRVGTKVRTVRCTVTQRNVAKGRATVSLKAKGRKAVAGRATVDARGRSVVSVKVSRKGSYTARITLPTPAGKAATITRRVTVR